MPSSSTRSLAMDLSVENRMCHFAGVSKNAKPSTEKRGTTPQDCPRMERCTFHRALLIPTPLFYPVPTPAEDCEYSNKHRDYRSARPRRDSVQEACCWRSRRHVYRCRNAKRDVAHPCLDRGGWLGLTAQVKCFLLDPECVTYMGCFGGALRERRSCLYMPTRVPIKLPHGSWDSADSQRAGPEQAASPRSSTKIFRSVPRKN